MSAADRLREFASKTTLTYAECELLYVIADQIEREQDERLMPDGIEWPRYEDGSLVQTGDDIVGPDYCENLHVGSIEFYTNGFSIHDGDARLDKWYESDMRFKRQPVLAADGEPIEVGQTVYETDDGTEFVVTSVELNRLHHVRAMQEKPFKANVSIHPTRLTHIKPEPPDSWERIEDDMKKSACEYLTGGKKKSGDGCPCPDDCPSLIADNMDVPCMSVMVRDIVRRCKALAEASE